MTWWYCLLGTYLFGLSIYADVGLLTFFISLSYHLYFGSVEVPWILNMVSRVPRIIVEAWLNNANQRKQ